MTTNPIKIYSKEVKNPREVGEFLKTIGERLANEGSFSLQHGEQEYNITPSSNTELEVKYTEKPHEHELEIEIEWKPESGGISIK